MSGVRDISEMRIAGVHDSSEIQIAGVQDTGEMRNASVRDTGNLDIFTVKKIAGVQDSGKTILIVSYFYRILSNNLSKNSQNLV